MRTIKFRAWDRVERHFRYPEIGVFGTFYTCEPPQQYIGLHDSQGNEIWEGDVLNTPAGIGSVAWIDGAWYLVWPTGGKTTLHDCPQNHLKVIGNIHENPELLEKGG